MNYKKLFMTVWDELQESSMFAAMEATVEDSPWHREANVKVHTQMVVSEFLKQWTDDFDKKMYMAALAAVFHDVGKPDAEEERWSEERGKYRRYAGHEHVSAVAWLDYTLKMTSEEHYRLQLTDREIYFVAWMIEYHLPYDVKDRVKRAGLYATPAYFGALDAFVCLLRADARGRTSDDHDVKLVKVEAWIEDFLAMPPPVLGIGAGKVAYVLIGTSSSGKTTARAALEQMAAAAQKKIEVFNQDQIRVDTFPSEGTVLERYEHAVRMSFTEDTQTYNAAVEKRLNEVFAAGADFVVSDNCNLSKKARSAFIARARQKGYMVHGLLLLAHPELTLGRQHHREDRSGVPIRQQFKALTVPTLFSELDDVLVQRHEMPTVFTN